MNDDCKLLQVQDEQQASTCADKYCKNFETTTAEHENERDENASKINEISTTNSRINRKHNLNLDLYFDKELSVWLAERERKQQQIEPRTDKDNESAITNTENDMTTSIARDDEWNSSEKLSNEMISIGTNNFDDNSSNSHRHFSDSFSSSSSTCHNSEIDMRLIDARSCCDKKSDNGVNGRSSTFTDGEFIYGPYNFDLFSNEFYHFRDEVANDDEAEKHRRIINSELLKNHDEVDNAAEVSFVRDMEAYKGCEISRNDCSGGEKSCKE
jgi:hypothetical protein